MVTTLREAHVILAVDDPNWLLSTMAQSAAALVAIVGGLIVTRVISLRGEVNSIDLERAKIEQRQATIEVGLQRRHEELSPLSARLAEDKVMSTHAADRLQLLRDEIGDLDEEAGELVARDGYLDQRRQELVVPSDLLGARRVLTYFGVLGVALPVVVMWFGGADVQWARALSVVGFLGGLGGVGTYLWRIVSQNA